MTSFNPDFVPANATATITVDAAGGVEHTFSVAAMWSSHRWFKSSLAGVLTLHVALNGEAAYTGTVEVLLDGRAVSQNMAYTDQSRFGRMGMPEAALLAARQVLGVPIYSSSNRQSEWWLTTESQQREARKVWERLVRYGATPPANDSDRFMLG